MSVKKQLKKISFEDIQYPNFTWMQNIAGMCVNQPNTMINELKSMGWSEANKQDALTQFIQHNPIPWKVNIYLPFFSQRSANQGYTKMINELETALSQYGVQFTPSLNQETDSILIINSVWASANTGDIASQKINATKLGIKIGMFTMFESTKWMDVHFKELQNLDYLIVPSEWNKICLLNQGYDKPIYVCPLPNDEKFHFVERPEKRDVFTFLMYNAMDYRKGYPEYLEAFQNEFKDETDVKFILKTRENDPAVANNYIQNPIFGDKIKWIIKTMTTQEVVLLHQNTDCFVFPSKGEGWGYPPIEALITGNPVITTKAHSHLEWFNNACLEVGTELVPASYSISGEEQEGTGDWYKPNVEDLQKQMRYIYEEYKREGRNATIFKNAKDQSTIIKNRFDKKLVAEHLIRIFEDQNILSYEKEISIQQPKRRGRPRKDSKRN